MLAPSVAKAPSYIDPFCCCECDRECAAVSYNKYLFKSTEFDDPLTIFFSTTRANPASRALSTFVELCVYGFTDIDEQTFF